MNLRKFWKFVWEDDSILSWIVAFALAFLLVKFVFYPLGGLAFGTDFPIVAVVSGSMEHKISNGQICGNLVNSNTKNINFDQYWKVCGNWYEKRGISKEEFKSYPFSGGFNKGDVMLIYGTKFEKLKKGEVIVFWGASPEPIIHRIVEIEDDVVKTKGDNNAGTHKALGEDSITRDKYLGRAIFRVPYLGWPKIWFVKIINTIKGVV